MVYVYRLSEDDFDDEVYVYLLEMILGVLVKPIPVRVRRGGGVGKVRKALPLLLSAIRNTGSLDDTYFLIAIDNDRALEHPAHQPLPHSAKEDCRHCRLTDDLHARMPDGWPIPGAIAVPVQMIESWLLLIHDPVRYPHESTLPTCSRSDQAIARQIYGREPPPQLKDLFDEARGASGLTKTEFALACVLRLDPADLGTRSRSFARFLSDISKWRTPVGA